MGGHRCGMALHMVRRFEFWCLVQADVVTRESPAPAGGVVIETFCLGG